MARCSRTIATGLNVKWDASENQTLSFDASNSVAKLNPGGELTSIDVDVGYGPSGPGGTQRRTSV